MSKKKLLSLSLFLFLSTFIVFVSCNDENELPSKTSTKISNKYAVSINNKTHKVSIKDDNITAKDADTDTYIVENLITLDETMPSFNTEEELINYINNNPELLKGHYELIIDNVVVYSSDIKDGEESNVYKLPGGGALDNYPCSYEGIRKCAVDRIHNMNWLQKWQCIAEGLNCVLWEMANCAVDNC